MPKYINTKTGEVITRTPVYSVKKVKTFGELVFEGICGFIAFFFILGFIGSFFA